MPAPPRAGLRTMVIAILTVATLDLSYVWVLWVLVRQKITTEQLLQSIATGLLGREAYQGGPPTAFLGGVLHVLIAAIWCTIFWLLLRHLPRLGAIVARPRGRVLLGFAWGMVIWWCMDLIVLPLSRARPVPIGSGTFLVNTVQHGLMIGIPMALILGWRFTAHSAET